MRSDLPLAEVLDLGLDDLALRILRYCVGRTPSRAHILSPWTWQIGNTGLPWVQVEAKVATAWELLLHLEPIRELVTHDGVLTAELTERGKAVAERDDDLRRARAETRIALGVHPLLDMVETHFLRGDHATAAFEAMREVEIQVRDRAQLLATDVGQALMRKAFDSESGPLHDPGRPTAENESTSHLFAGAIGLYKNPASHRRVDYSDSMAAAGVILLADQLLREPQCGHEARDARLRCLVRSPVPHAAAA
jgi:uncharacterized protein (TIGR02391 family)